MSIWWLVAVGLAGWVCIGLTYAVGFVVDHARARRDVRVPPHDSTYTLADDIDVPLIEVVLDAEARADPNYWKPKTWADVGRWVAEADTLRPSPQLPDPHRTATEHAHAILNMRDPLEEEVV